MIQFVFTVDYEIYGNGQGSLRDLVYEPAEKLKAIFRRHGARFVVFVEAAELEAIEAQHADDAIEDVKRQIRGLHGDGFEIGLHIHPQWYNARYINKGWQLDYGEYNLCLLPLERIDRCIGRSISFLRKILADPGYVPFSFRAGNWLLQPTAGVAKLLARHGIKMDSSVYKGGRQSRHGLDYRRALSNGYFWRFSEDVNVPDPAGILVEIPTFTRMVPIWKMFTAKRIGLQQKAASRLPARQGPLTRLKDYARLCHPMKLDFCRMSTKEMLRLFDPELVKDHKDPSLYRPIVAIGHTKDLIDLNSVELFLSYLQKNGIPVSTFKEFPATIVFQGEAS
jgi:peptidoglycan/xylan/chitin deacetylase (PgdA/CDA1 family)